MVLRGIDMGVPEKQFQGVHNESDIGFTALAADKPVQISHAENLSFVLFQHQRMVEAGDKK